MDSLRRPLSSTLALSRADLAVGLREFDNAMRPFEDWLDGSIRLFRASAVGFVYLSMIVVAAAMYSLLLKGTEFFAPQIVLDYICAVALLGASGAVAWHYPIIRQRRATSGRLPPTLISASSG